MTAVNGYFPTGNNGCSPGLDGTGFTPKKLSVYGYGAQPYFYPASPEGVDKQLILKMRSD